MSRVRGGTRLVKKTSLPRFRAPRQTPDTPRDVAARLIPKGQFYVTGGTECAQFRLDDVIEAFGLTPDEAVFLVAQGMLL